MTSKQALAELIAKVEAGTCTKRSIKKTCLEAFGLGACWGLCFDAYQGSLDAALALHGAVLPDQSIRIERRSGGWVVWLDNPYQGISENPARAFLLEILKALHAQETDT